MAPGGSLSPPPAPVPLRIALGAALGAGLLLSAPLASAQEYSFPSSSADYGHFYPTAYYDEGGTTDWNCGGLTYSGHRGSDFGGGSWTGMDEGRDIVAAAAGTVVDTHDGEYDRCSTGDCPGGGGYGNYVKVQHDDGKTTIYAHLKTWTVGVTVGQAVSCGDWLGEMGSSGYSTGPHLHFEVRTSGGSQSDPFDGPCSSPPTYWVDQGAYGGLPGRTCDGGAVDADGDGHRADSDCNDGDPGVYPGAAETCDSRDQDCDGIVDEGTECYDDDGDGLAEIAGDCDDADAQRRPGLFEEPDGKDNDCDGEVDEHTALGDDDGDGYSEADGDCNDAAPSIAPGRTEVLNGLDDDCDGLADEGTEVFDDDGDGASEDQGDCDDADPTVHPGAEESPDGVDDDCDGTVDEGTDVFDDDGDGWSEASGDCDDWDPMAFPGASELPDGTDNDCDGLVDDGTDLYDDDGDGFAEVDGDCDDADPMTHPTATEAPDGVDDDCDGVVDEGTRVYDDDGDGFAEVDGDCDDGRSDAFPGAPEEVNDLDDDCDGRVDNDTPVFDDDGDGFCEALTCLDGAVPGDCDDLDPRIHPRAPEAPDGIDNDCDGQVEDYLGWGAGPQGACAHAPAGPAAPVGLSLLALATVRRRRR